MSAMGPGAHGTVREVRAVLRKAINGIAPYAQTSVGYDTSSMTASRKVAAHQARRNARVRKLPRAGSQPTFSGANRD